MKRGLLLIVIICINIGSAYAQNNTASRLVAESGYVYMNSQGKHILNDSVDYTYIGKNGYDSVRQFSEYEWNFSEKWYIDYDTLKNIFYQDKAIVQYDTFGSIVVIRNYFLDSTSQSSAFDTVGLNVDTIQNGVHKSAQYYEYKNSQWDTSYRIEYYWNVNKMIDSYYVFLWQPTMQSWAPSSKEVYDYQTSQLVNRYNLQFNNNTSVFDTTLKYFYTYLGSFLKEVYYETKPLGGTKWGKGRRTTYSHDANGNVDTLLLFNWDILNTSWYPITREISTYNTSGLEVKLISQIVMAGNFVNDKSFDFSYNNDKMLTKRVSKRWSTSSNQFNDWYIYNYYYEKYNLVDTPNSIHNVVNDNIVLDIYPVPANNYLHINLRTREDVNINIYTSTGKLVKVQRLIGGRLRTNLNTISVADLPAGNYIISIFNRSFIENRQINIIK